MKTFYYSDEVRDDFAATNGKIGHDRVDGDYPYIRRSVLWKIAVFIVYRVFVTPIVWIYTKFWLGIRVKNRRALKGIGGCFIYMNHTQDICDAFLPTIAAFPKKAYVITGAEAVSIHGIRVLVSMLGAIPLPSTLPAHRNYEQRLRQVIDEGSAVLVFPEAHIWPYCNFVRSFPDTSFAHPVKLDAPVIAAVVVYRERRFLKHHHPHATVYLSDPLYPDPQLKPRQARKKLRDEAYDFMSRTAKEHHSYEYIRYEYREKADTDQI